MRMQSLVLGAVFFALVSLPAAAGDAGWINGGWQTYNARGLKLADVVGTVRIDVKDNGPIAVQVSGNPERVQRVHIKQTGDTLKLECEAVGSVWDWRHWFDFRGGNNNPGQLQIHIAVPRGLALDVEELAGNVTIGNTYGPLKFSVAGYTESTIGAVASANIDMAGSGRVTVGNVGGEARIDSAGSGNIRIGDAGRLKADIAGSGSIAAGNVAAIDVDIAGSGDFSAQSVHGPTSISIAGAGSVTIGGGEASAFHVEIMGSGNVAFGGVAVNPKLEAMGSGSIRLKAYRGNIQNDGAKLTIGP